jgi:hypothetical protein
MRRELSGQTVPEVFIKTIWCDLQNAGNTAERLDGIISWMTAIKLARRNFPVIEFLDSSFAPEDEVFDRMAGGAERKKSRPVDEPSG